MTMGSDATIVLMYHSVASVDDDPFWVTVRPEHFAEQVEAIQEVADVVPLHSVLERESGRRVAITLDDGYRDNLETALPTLTAAGAPATVFVASDVLSGAGFWWHRMERLIGEGHPRRAILDIEGGGRRVRVDVHTSAGRRRAMLVASRLLRSLPGDEIDRALERVADQLGQPPPLAQPVPLLTASSLAPLIANGLVQIGGHTRTHTMLSALNADEQWQEIAGCKRAIEDVTGMPATAFAYPYGEPRSFDRRTPRLVRKAGFDLACTTSPGRVGRWTNRYRVPRVAVRDWGRGAFLRELGRAFDALE